MSHLEVSTQSSESSSEVTRPKTTSKQKKGYFSGYFGGSKKSKSSKEQKDVSKEPQDYSWLLGASIEETEILSEDVYALSKKSYVVYKVAVSTKFYRYCLCKRYNEFFDLHESLKVLPGFVFEKFPSKTFFRWTNEDFIEERRNQLDEFIKYAVEFCQESQNMDQLSPFLELDKCCSLRNLMSEEINQVSKLPRNQVQHLDALEAFLFRLNLETADRLAVLRELSIFIYKNYQLISKNSLKVLLMGESGTQGALQMFALCKERNSLIDLECKNSLT